MSNWKHFYPARTFGECPTIDLTDDERMKAKDMRREVTKRIVATMSDDDRKRYLKERSRVSTMRLSRKKNPIKCGECVMGETCIKRLKHNLDCCPTGVRIKKGK